MASTGSQKIDWGLVSRDEIFYYFIYLLNENLSHKLEKQFNNPPYLTPISSDLFKHEISVQMENFAEANQKFRYSIYPILKFQLKDDENPFIESIIEIYQNYFLLRNMICINELCYQNTKKKKIAKNLLEEIIEDSGIKLEDDTFKKQIKMFLLEKFDTSLRKTIFFTPGSSNQQLDEFVEKYCKINLWKRDTLLAVNKDDFIPDMNVVYHSFMRGELISHSLADRILKIALMILKKEKTLIHLQGPINICGDILGQFFDLNHIFEKIGPVKTNKYVFLGNYIGKSELSIETLLYILSLKIAYPKQLNLLRGSNETLEFLETSDFQKHCLMKYDQAIYAGCLKVFQQFPLAAVIDDKILCVHSGMSPLIETITDIEKIERSFDAATNGASVDLLRSVPVPNYDRELGLPAFIRGSRGNMQKGEFYYSYHYCIRFLMSNNLLTMVRGHTPEVDGYREYLKNYTTEFPSIITIFSAPNYKRNSKNMGAVLTYSKFGKIMDFMYTPFVGIIPPKKKKSVVNLIL